MEPFHGTTILSVRRGKRVALGGDGQVTLGNIVIKASARKVRRLYHDQHPGRICRRHGRCLHAVRALRGQAGEASGQPAALGGGTRQGLAHRPHAAPARGDAGGGRPRDVRSSSPATATCSSRSRASWPSAAAAPYAQAAARALLENTELHAAGDRQEVARPSPATFASTPISSTSSKCSMT